jgi:hypothetical protein
LTQKVTFSMQLFRGWKREREREIKRDRERWGRERERESKRE